MGVFFHAITYQTDCRGILAEQLGVCSCPELPEMVVVVVEKLVVLPQEWRVEGVLQAGQTGQVEEVEHRNQNLKHGKVQDVGEDRGKRPPDLLRGSGAGFHVFYNTFKSIKIEAFVTYRLYSDAGSHSGSHCGQKTPTTHPPAGNHPPPRKAAAPAATGKEKGLRPN